MKKTHAFFFMVVLVSCFTATTVLAEPKGKDEWESGKEQMKNEKEMKKKEREEAKKLRKAEREEEKRQKELEKEERKQAREMEKEKRKQEKETAREKRDDDRSEKQLDKRTEYREQGKGSEQGQLQREEVKKKWWKFWE